MTAPGQVVNDYYAAINAGDYRRAWNLGGRNVRHVSYQQFRNGFKNTATDTATVVSVKGDTVHILLDAEQTNGTHQHFTGTYVVRDGVIASATMK